MVGLGLAVAKSVRICLDFWHGLRASRRISAANEIVHTAALTKRNGGVELCNTGRNWPILAVVYGLQLDISDWGTSRYGLGCF